MNFFREMGMQETTDMTATNRQTSLMKEVNSQRKESIRLNRMKRLLTDIEDMDCSSV